MQFPTVRRLGGSVTFSCDWATSNSPPASHPPNTPVSSSHIISISLGPGDQVTFFTKCIPSPQLHQHPLSHHSLYSSNGPFAASPCLSSIITPSSCLLHNLPLLFPPLLSPLSPWTSCLRQVSAMVSAAPLGAERLRPCCSAALKQLHRIGPKVKRSCQA